MYRNAMIDHIGIRVSNVERSVEFYTKVLAPLGYELIMRWEQHAGFGVGGKPDFWLDGSGAPKEHQHVAFRAGGRQQVRDFFAAALAAGGTDNGPPGPRAHYHEHY